MQSAVRSSFEVAGGRESSRKAQPKGPVADPASHDEAVCQRVYEAVRNLTDADESLRRRLKCSSQEPDVVTLEVPQRSCVITGGGRHDDVRPAVTVRRKRRRTPRAAASVAGSPSSGRKAELSPTRHENPGV